MEEVFEFIKVAGTYFLATSDSGQPRVRPFGSIDYFEGRLYIHTDLTKDVARQMLANPKVELCALHGGRWIRVSAEAVRADDPAAEDHMLEARPVLKSTYRPGDGRSVIFALKNGTATVSSFIDEPRVYAF